MSVMNEEVAERQKWDLSAVGLRLLDPDLPLSEFSDLCWQLGRIHGAVRFAIGDAIIMGEELYGARAFQAFENLGLSEEGMMEYRRVSEKVPRSIRRKGVSWSHHRAVATLLPDKQKEWLLRAEKKGLSHAALRDALRNGAEPRAVTTCRCCGRELLDPS